MLLHEIVIRCGTETLQSETVKEEMEEGAVAINCLISKSWIELHTYLNILVSRVYERPESGWCIKRINIGP